MDTEHPKRRQSRNVQRNRELILATARQLFAEHGPEATSMNQIALAAQIGPGTLYRHFANKRLLGKALMEDDFVAFQQRATAIVARSTAPYSAVECLDLLIDAILDLVMLHIPLFNIIQEGGAGRLSPYQGPVYSWMYTQIVQVLTTAVNTNQLRFIDIEHTADLILVGITPPLFAFQHQQRGFNRSRIKANLQRLFIEYLRVPSPSS